MRKYFLFAAAIPLMALVSACADPELQEQEITNLRSAYESMESDKRHFVKKSLRYAGMEPGPITDQWDPALVPALTQARDSLAWEGEVNLESEAGAARFLSLLATVNGRNILADGIVDPEAPWVLVKAIDEEASGNGVCAYSIGEYERNGEHAAVGVYLKAKRIEGSGEFGLMIAWDGWQGREGSQSYGLTMDSGGWPTNGEISHMSPERAVLKTYNDNWENILRLMETTDTLTVRTGGNIDPIDPFLFEQGNFRAAALSLKKCFNS